jgi:hypothetical protein
MQFLKFHFNNIPPTYGQVSHVVSSLQVFGLEFGNNNVLVIIAETVRKHRYSDLLRYVGEAEDEHM